MPPKPSAAASRSTASGKIFSASQRAASRQHAVGRELPRRVAEGLLVLGEREIHAGGSYRRRLSAVKQATLRLPCGSRDNPSPWRHAFPPSAATRPRACAATAARTGRAGWWPRHKLSVDDLIWPVFVQEGKNERTPGGLDAGRRSAHDRSVRRGRQGSARSRHPRHRDLPRDRPKAKTPDAREAYNPDNLVCRAIRAVKKAVPRHRHRLRRGARSLQQRRP